jgi:hypothetical protein
MPPPDEDYRWIIKPHSTILNRSDGEACYILVDFEVTPLDGLDAIDDSASN